MLTAIKSYLPTLVIAAKRGIRPQRMLTTSG